MKRSYLISMMLTLAQAQGAWAKFKWVETPFWRAPQVTELDVGLQGGGPGLEEECATFEKYVQVFKDNPGRIDLKRRALLPIRFIIPTDEQLRIEQSLEVKRLNSPDLLPYFTQHRAVSGVELQEDLPLLVKAAPASLSEVTRFLKLSGSEVSWERSGEGLLQISTTGLDLACDLLAGRAEIHLEAPSYLYLHKEDAVKIFKFYNDALLPKISGLIKSNIPNHHKALRLGFRIGKLLEEETPDLPEEEVDRQLVELLQRLFNLKSLTPSKHLVEEGNRHRILTSEEPQTQTILVRLQMGREGL